MNAVPENSMIKTRGNTVSMIIHFFERATNLCVHYALSNRVYRFRFNANDPYKFKFREQCTVYTVRVTPFIHKFNLTHRKAQVFVRKTSE